MKQYLIQALCLLVTSLLAAAGKNVHQHGYWYGEQIESEHAFDPQLAQALVDFFTEQKAESIVDFGCGMGDYVKVLLAHGFTCQGYDGNPDTFALSGGVAEVCDLSQPFDLGRTFDWVMCLEVAEHLPKQYEKTLIENLTRHNTQGVVLTWAIKGQGGFGHFNERNNDYVKKLMAKYGYTNDESAEQKIRELAQFFWFKNSVMVFRKGL